MNQGISPLDIQAIVREIAVANQENSLIEPFSNRWPGLDTKQAYYMGRLLHERKISRKAISAGRKIGFTNADMWALYGVNKPVWSWMYDHSIRHLPASQGRCCIEKLVQPKLEPELVVHFHQAPPCGGTLADILACIDWIALGYEIVQCHYPGWKFKGVDTIIDGGLHAELLVGEPLDIREVTGCWLSCLAEFDVYLYRDGELHDQGCGANVLGSPLKAIAHLMSVIAADPAMEPLRAGELVTTGTLTKAWDITPGEHWRVEVRGLELPPLQLSIDRPEIEENTVCNIPVAYQQ
ncbi:MAG: hypothetical protein OIF57_12495 [Marinobacterium sp.]|nr:hypothetical protein [Marinobacterium sp.]